MTRQRLIGCALAGLSFAWLVSPHLYREFGSARRKVVSEPVTATDVVVRVPLADDPAYRSLRTPFAVIARLKSGEETPVNIRLTLDGREICEAEIAPARSRRVDCAVRNAWTGEGPHEVRFVGNRPGYVVEYLELASHFGAITAGPRHLIIGPAGFRPARAASPSLISLVAVLFALSFLSLSHPAFPRFLVRAHQVLTAGIVLFTGLAIVAPLVSEYALLIQGPPFARVLGIAALPRVVLAVAASVRWLLHPRRRAMTQFVTVGLLVGLVFLSLVRHRLEHRYTGQVSGLLKISHGFFDGHPAATQPAARNRILFDQGPGYDAQFFYMMAFDPVLTAFPNDPARYDVFIDNPSYRYGRIGFSGLTWIFAGGRPERFPAVMVALIVAALAVGAVLLALIARHYGASGWYGTLVAVVPGFWQSVENTLPEPLAVAFWLGAYLAMLKRQWWVCGALLGVSMLVRETGGVLVLAVCASVWLLADRRTALRVAALAFGPIVLWKLYVASVFFPIQGFASVMALPDDSGVPFGGVYDMWVQIARGDYYPWNPALIRSGVIYPPLLLIAIALVSVTAFTRPAPMTIAAACYAGLIITYNFHGVWAHVANAERLTVDLFVALLIVGLQPTRATRPWSHIWPWFWLAAAAYVFLGTFEAASYRQALLLLPNWLCAFSLCE